MEQQSWRTGLAQNSRNKIVSKIMDKLKKHTSVIELWRIAHRFEEEIFYSASDQHDYLRKISLKMLNLETRTQSATSNTLPTGSSGTNQGPVRPLVDAGSIAQGQSWQQVGQPTPAGMLNNGIQGSAGGPVSSFSSINNVPQPPLANAGSIAQVQSRQQGFQPTPAGMLNSGIQGSAGGPTSSFSNISNGPNQGPVRPLVDSGGPGDSLQQVGQAGGIDQADIVWSKMQTLKEKYLQDMKDLFSMLTTRSQQHMPQEQLQKLTHYKTVLQRMMPYLIAPKGSLPKDFKQDKVEAFEKQIVSIMETFKRRKQGNLGPPPAGQQPQQAAQILQPDNKLLQQEQQQQQQQTANEQSSN